LPILQRLLLILQRLLRILQRLDDVQQFGGPPTGAQPSDGLPNTLVSRQHTSNERKNIPVANGPERSWKLPDRGDKLKIRRVRDEAVASAEEKGASIGK